MENFNKVNAGITAESAGNPCESSVNTVEAVELPCENDVKAVESAEKLCEKSDVTAESPKKPPEKTYSTFERGLALVGALAMIAFTIFLIYIIGGGKI